MIAFDADVLIYSAQKGHRAGVRVATLLAKAAEPLIGSVLLLPEVLSKPMRVAPDGEETRTLIRILSRLDLQAMDEQVARFAMHLGAKYTLRAADATHLATAVAAGADRFLTNNRRDFPHSITEVDIVYPDELPALR